MLMFIINPKAVKLSFYISVNFPFSNTEAYSYTVCQIQKAHPNGCALIIWSGSQARSCVLCQFSSKCTLCELASERAFREFTSEYAIHHWQGGALSLSFILTYIKIKAYRFGTL